MKTITINFKRWSCGANNGKTLNRIYNRFYLFGYTWTPIVIVEWSLAKRQNHEWSRYDEYTSKCFKCDTFRFREPNHEDYIHVYYTKKNPFGSLDIPKCKK
jgi:hypothetical protein